MASVVVVRVDLARNAFTTSSSSSSWTYCPIAMLGCRAPIMAPILRTWPSRTLTSYLRPRISSIRGAVAPESRLRRVRFTRTERLPKHSLSDAFSKEGRPAMADFAQTAFRVPRMHDLRELTPTNLPQVHVPENSGISSARLAVAASREHA